MKTPYILSIYFLSLLLLHVACIEEQELPFTPNTTTVAVTFQTQLSASNNTQAISRFITPTQENQITEVEILAFEKSGANYLFAYRTSGSDYLAPNVDGLVEFTANLRPSDNDQIFVIVANATTCLNAIAIASGENITEVLPRLILTKQQEFEAHNNGGSEFTPIPMYAQTSAIHIANNTTSIGPYSLIRMLARIDVVATANNFKLTEAAIYNRKNKGYIPYNETQWDATSKKVTAAYVPSNAVSTYAPSVVYESIDDAITNTIYTFEAKGVSDPKKATTIIMGGYFNYPTNTTTLSYYRVDIPTFIANVAQANTCGDILRNHLYQINVNAVLGGGHPSVEEAFNNDGKQLDVTITPWNLSTKIDVDIEKPNSIFIIKSQFNYDSTGTKTRLLKFTSNGVCTASTNETWLHTTTIKAVGDAYTLTYIIDPLTSGSDRFGYINLKVGNLIKKVRIDQYADAAIKYLPQGFFLTEDIEYDLQLKARAPWILTIYDNPSGVIETVSKTSGTVSSNSIPLMVSFKYLEGVYNASISISSTDGEFDPYLIPLQAVGAYDFPDLDFYIYPVDQPRSLTWYTYANTPDGYNTLNVPPGSGTQMNPPRENSCACIKSTNAQKAWRLPTEPELRQIYDKVKLPKISSTVPYYAANPYFVITHNFEARCWYYSSQSGATYRAKVVGFTPTPYSSATPENGFKIANLNPHTGSNSDKIGTKPFGTPGSTFDDASAFEGARCVRSK